MYQQNAERRLPQDDCSGAEFSNSEAIDHPITPFARSACGGGAAGLQVLLHHLRAPHAEVAHGLDPPAREGRE